MASTKPSAFTIINSGSLVDADVVPIIAGNTTNRRTLLSSLAAYLAATTAIAEVIRDTIGTALTAGSRITLTVNDAGDTITVQTKEQHPGYVAGRIYACSKSNAATATVVADRLYLQEWTVHHPITVASIGFRNGTGAVGNVLFGIYSSANGNPDALLFAGDSAPSTNSSNANITASFTGATLQPGTYFVGTIFSGTPSISCCTNTNYDSSYTCGNASGASYSVGTTGLEISTQTYAGGLPSSASSAIASTGNVPRNSFIVS